MLDEHMYDAEKSSTENAHGQRRSACGLLMSYLASDLGLLIVVVAYSVGGAYLFIYLEQYIELKYCQLGSLEENISVTKISEELYYYVVASTDNTSVIYDGVVEYLANFTSDIYDRKSNYRYIGQDCLTVSGWTFSSALFFTITTIASIGFGNVVPVTWEGQITCICYSLIGIPIFLICLTKISAIMSNVFRLGYSGFLNCICCYCRIRSRRIKNHLIQAGKPSKKYEADYLGTISYEPSWPEENQQLDNSDDDIDNEFDYAWYRLKSHVPVIVIIAIIVGYLYLGAFMCYKFEEWTMTESIYFCYVALSTIGFGDYVPGITSGSPEAYRFMATSIYIVVGLAVLAMCFELMKDSIVDEFERIAKKFGFAVDDDDQIDDEHIQYAHFEYAKHEENNHKQIHGDDAFYDLPPAYDLISTDGQWISNIKDKDESKNKVSNLKTIRT